MLLDKQSEISKLGMNFHVEGDTVVLKTLPSYGKLTFGVESFHNLVEELQHDHD
jgi:hypothetical protein